METELHCADRAPGHGQWRPKWLLTAALLAICAPSDATAQMVPEPQSSIEQQVPAAMAQNEPSEPSAPVPVSVREPEVAQPVGEAQTGDAAADQADDATSAETPESDAPESDAPGSDAPGSDTPGSGIGLAAPLPAPPFLEDPAGAVDHWISAFNVPTAEGNPRSDLPHDLSPLGMFMAADWVVKAVMIGLMIASLATWIIWLAKSAAIVAARARARRALAVVGSADNLFQAAEALRDRGGPGALMALSAEHEFNRSAENADKAGHAGLRERVVSRLSRIEAQSGRRLSRGTGLLATIGSTAPFVGLFGTVWGIMNAFIGISEAQTTNLAVVAPGIAEALLATAIGLVAAIPAVVIYNVFARSIASYRNLLADVAAGVEQLVSFDLDCRTANRGEAGPGLSRVGG
ncbi:tonB-system energizer ExbB [Hoeflea sp.]|uniref:tonB-system energizer ExbB n=1 Tax=Hoeflea sp. TaxID=1940281 RepID=UPI0037486879